MEGLYFRGRRDFLAFVVSIRVWTLIEKQQTGEDRHKAAQERVSVSPDRASVHTPALSLPCESALGHGVGKRSWETLNDLIATFFKTASNRAVLSLKEASARAVLLRTCTLLQV